MSGRVYDAQLPLKQRRLKRASRALVNSVGTQSEAADILGMKKDGQRRISELVSPNCPDSLTLFKWSSSRRKRAARPIGRRSPARSPGSMISSCWRWPSALPGVVDWHRGMGEVSREAAEVVNRVCQALADDNKVTRARNRAIGIIEQIEEALAKLANLKAMARAIAQGDE
jgi:hypothetical protein